MMNETTKTAADQIRTRQEHHKQILTILDRKIANPPSKEEIEETIRRFDDHQRKLWIDPID